MIQEYMGMDSDMLIVALALLVFLLIMITLINAYHIRKLRIAYNDFMRGSNGESLEDTLIERLNQIDDLIEMNAVNERNIDTLIRKSKLTFRKYGLIKYDALQELGGKLSFTLCMLNELDNGYILNVVHSREGCYSYVKEVIDGNAIVNLAREEEAALEKALSDED